MNLDQTLESEFHFRFPKTPSNQVSSKSITLENGSLRRKIHFEENVTSNSINSNYGLIRNKSLRKWLTSKRVIPNGRIFRSDRFVTHLFWEVTFSSKWSISKWLIFRSTQFFKLAISSKWLISNWPIIQVAKSGIDPFFQWVIFEVTDWGSELFSKWPTFRSGRLRTDHFCGDWFFKLAFFEVAYYLKVLISKRLLFRSDLNKSTFWSTFK